MDSSDSEDDVPECEVCSCFKKADMWEGYTKCCHVQLCSKHWDKMVFKCSECDFEMCEICNDINHIINRCKVCEKWKCKWCDKSLKRKDMCKKCTDEVSIRVGRRITVGGKPVDPTYPGFKKILCLTPSTPYGSLGPYCLKDENGVIMENKWQFSKIWSELPKSTQVYSKYDKKVIWDHPAETHIHFDKNGRPYISPKYWEWRRKGFECEYPIRYPATYDYRREAYGSLKEGRVDPSKPKYKGIHGLLSYIDARKEIYLPEYMRLVRKEPQYHKLLNMLRKGEKLLIVEVDGPHQESLEYYKKKYNVDDTFIEDNTIAATAKNMDIMLNDEKHSFGHGYCLAIALLEDSIEIY